MEDKLRIIIVDDHEFFRNGLKMVINRLKYARVAGEASNGREFLDLLEDTDADMVLMDIQMPVMNGIEATEIALKRKHNLKVIALTMFNEEEYVQRMLDAGVKGFLLKNITKDTLDQALQTVASGNSYYSPELMDFFTRAVTKENKPTKPDIQFTKREMEVLHLLCDGMSNKEIADSLFISERTVVGHKSNLLQKTDTKSTIGLLAWAIKNKVVEIE